MKRREFITLLGGAAAAWPLAAGAQQPAMPLIGFLQFRAPRAPHLVDRFRQGLSEAGYVAGQNVAIEYRQAESQTIGCGNWQPIWFARGWRSSPRPGQQSGPGGQSTTTTIPIVFTSGGDPVQLGLVSASPAGWQHVTGVSLSAWSLGRSSWGSCASWFPGPR